MLPSLIMKKSMYLIFGGTSVIHICDIVYLQEIQGVSIWIHGFDLR